MTISYNGDISCSRTFSFLRIICRWKGSIWKSVFVELVSWVVMYYITMFTYRQLMTEVQRRLFAKFAQYANATIDYLPLTFMLGAAIFCSSVFQGKDEETMQRRRNVLRYMVLTQVLVLRDISLQVRKRFPSLQAIVDSGFMMPHEKKLMDQVTDEYNRYWLPIHWACTLCQQARLVGHIQGDAQTSGLIKEIISFRGCLQVLCNYDWVPVPLAYPQVVFMAVRMYFFLCLICRQFLYPGDTVTRTVYTMIDLRVPVMTMLQFIFYMGWMKVAEALLNPLGEDDDDLECNYIIDRNATIAMYLADPCNGLIPEPKTDSFKFGYTPLYSEDASYQVIHPLIGSAATIMPDLPKEAWVRMVPLNEEEAMENDPIRGTASLKNWFGLRRRTMKFFHISERRNQKRHTQPKRHNIFALTKNTGVVPAFVDPVTMCPSKDQNVKVTCITCNDDTRAGSGEKKN